MRKLFLDFVPGLIGATIAACGGYWIVWRVSQQNLYMPVLPGAFAGLACGFLSVSSSKVRGILCAGIALGAGLYTQWKVLLRRVETDGSFLDFLAHIHTETPVTLAMLAIGTFLGYWWGRETTSPWRGRFKSSHPPIESSKSTRHQ